MPPEPSQPNGDSLFVLSNYLMDKAVVLGNNLFASHHAGHVWDEDGGTPRAILKLYRLDIGSQPAAVKGDSIFGLPGFDYYFPSVQPTVDGDMVIVFGRSSSAGEFPSIRFTTWPAGAGISGSRLLRAGSGSYTNGRWGDYFGIQLDPESFRKVWAIGEYSLGGTNWNTWVSEMTLSRSPIIHP